MSKIPVIAIFDIGKTNKKLLLFDKNYQLIHEIIRQFEETRDEDDFLCEDIHALKEWITGSIDSVRQENIFEIRAMNFSAYGASFVLLNDRMDIARPLYSYLKPYPQELANRLYEDYGGEVLFSRQTASPCLGNLNSGLQLYKLKHDPDHSFSDIRHAVHLPQYLSFIFTNTLYSDMTSIGCHTALWDFDKSSYHDWVGAENIERLLPAIREAGDPGGYLDQHIPVGIGLHDSSAALVPYLESFSESFVLVSTGTWIISMNPFNQQPLTAEELLHDCLCFLSVKGTPVKSSRLFAGNEHEQQTRLMDMHFNKQPGFYKTIFFNENLMKNPGWPVDHPVEENAGQPTTRSSFSKRSLHPFPDYETAYHQLISDIIERQVKSTALVLLPGTKNIFVDGGFSQNEIYMNLLALAYPQLNVYAAVVPQASALGAALLLHDHWNDQPLPGSLVRLQKYPRFNHPAA